jgi:hypothetical protein
MKEGEAINLKHEIRNKEYEEAAVFSPIANHESLITILLAVNFLKESALRATSPCRLERQDFKRQESIEEWAASIGNPQSTICCLLGGLVVANYFKSTTRVSCLLVQSAIQAITLRLIK